MSQTGDRLDEFNGADQPDIVDAGHQTVRLPFGAHPVYVQSSPLTPYVQVVDVNGAPILAIGILATGCYAVHCAESVQMGPSLTELDRMRHGGR